MRSIDGDDMKKNSNCKNKYQDKLHVSYGLTCEESALALITEDLKNVKVDQRSHRVACLNESCAGIIAVTQASS